MSFTIKSAKLTGKPNDYGWAQVYEFKPGSDKELVTRGELDAVISISDETSGVVGIANGREMLKRLQAEFYSSKTNSVFEALSTSLKNINSGYFEKADIEIATMVLCGDVLYLSACGGARIAILRNGDLVNLVKSRKGEVVSASGRVQNDDFYLLGTSSFFKCFSSGIIKGAFSKGDVNDAADVFNPKIQSLEDGEKIGALLTKFERDDFITTSTVNVQTSDLEQPVLKSVSGYGSIVPKKPKNITLYARIGSLVTKFDGIDKLRKDRIRGIGLDKTVDSQHAGISDQNTEFSQRSASYYRSVRGLINTLRGKKIYVDRSREEVGGLHKSKKVSVGVGIILLVILGLSVFLGIKQRRDLEIKSKYQNTLNSAQHDMEEAKNLYNLDPERSRELLVSARDKVLGLQDENFGDATVVNLKAKIKDSEESILGEYKTDAQLFVDLSLQSNKFKGDIIHSSNEKLYVLDRDGRKIIGVTISTKGSEIVAGPNDMAGADNFAVYVNRVFVLSSDGIAEVGDKNTAINNEWSGEVIPYVYGGNFYILEKDTSMIYRYSATDSGFGSKNAWLSQDVTVDLTGARDWVIDGSIWVVTEDGKILRFSQGNKIAFTVSGVIPEVEHVKAIYTNEELESLYILDTDNSRVVVVGKDGKYKAQYIINNAKDAIGLVVSEKERKIILLTGEKLYSIDLKHLN